MPDKRAVPIRRISEPCGEIELEDGSIHTFRLTVTVAHRFFEADGKPTVDTDGSAIYAFSSQQNFVTTKQPISKKVSN